jgi:outer membrane protein insertion porin family
MRTGVAVFLLAILGPAVAVAQNSPARKSSAKDMPATAFKLISVHVKGANRYQPAQIIATAGLELGQTVNENDFKRAVQRLAETGAFTETAYSFQYSAEGTKLELQVSETEQLVAVRFDNLVWFSDQDLMVKLQARVPLFQGQVPLSGNLLDQVSQGLQSLLDERNVQGRVDYVRAGHSGGPPEAIAFSVTGPEITIRNSEFPGAAPAELPLLQAAAKKQPAKQYLRSMLRDQENKDFLPIYLARGYLKAAFGDAQAKVVEETPQQTTVDAEFPVEPGRQYRISASGWTGNSVFPAEKLQTFLHLQAGQPANAIELGDDLQAAKKLYGTRGYLAVQIQPVPDFNDQASTVSYELRVSEGAVYHMGELEVRGLDSRATARVVERWKLHEGDAFDDSYANDFIETAVKDLSLGLWIATVQQAVNDDQTVDVTLRFESKK